MRADTTHRSATLDGPGAEPRATRPPAGADGTETRSAAAGRVGAGTRTRRFRTILLRLAVGFAAFMLVGNAAILLASGLASAVTGARPAPGVEGVDNFAVVDDRVWRGAAPEAHGYESLAAHGATTVVDLRAEAVDGGDEVDPEQLDALGLELVEIPIRDGQTPTPAEVRRFLEAIEGSQGPVFVHCGAGVGRSGAMVAAYLMATEQADAGERLRRNLSVGPPSLEQIAYAAWVDGDFDRPSLPVVAVSRLLDGPRRLWHVLT